MSLRSRRIFISYSHVDERLKERLVRHLRVVRRGIHLDVWEDRQIPPGAVFPTEIRAAIEAADIALLLISADFLTSTYVQEVEVPLILQRRDAGQMRIVPVLAQPCAWQDIEWLSELQIHPTDLKPLSEKDPAQVERDLTDLARMLLVPGVADGSKRWVTRVHAGARTVAGSIVAVLPALVTAAAVASAAVARGTTPLQLDLVARTVSFTIASETPVQLLNNLTAFSKLTVDGCDTVELPPLSMGVGDVTPVTYPDPVSLHCHQRIIGSRIGFRPLDPDFTGELGSLGPIAAGDGDRVLIALAAAVPPQLRLQVSTRASFDFELERDVPFEILSEYVAAEGITSPIGADDVGSYRARIPAAHRQRVARVDASQGLNIVVQLAEGADPDAVFRPDIDTPIESLSLFQRDDTRDGFVSTTIDGVLGYPERPDIQPVRIEAGDDVRLAGVTGFALKRLTMAKGLAGLSLRVQGDAAEARIDGSDRRLTLLQRAWGNKALAAFLLVAVAALQWVWMRRFRP